MTQFRSAIREPQQGAGSSQPYQANLRGGCDRTSRYCSGRLIKIEAVTPLPRIMEAVFYLANAATRGNVFRLLEEHHAELLDLSFTAAKRPGDVPLQPLAKAVKTLLPLFIARTAEVTSVPMRPAVAMRSLCLCLTAALDHESQKRYGQIAGKLSKLGVTLVLLEACKGFTDIIIKRQHQVDSCKATQQQQPADDHGSDQNSSISADGLCAMLGLYTVTSGVLDVWVTCCDIWDKKSAVPLHLVQSIEPVTRLALAVLHSASEQGTPSSSSSDGKDDRSTLFVTAVDTAAHVAFTMSILVSNISFQMLSGPPGFRQLLVKAPCIASDQALELLCISFGSVVMMNRRQKEAAAKAEGVTDSSSSSSSSSTGSKQTQLPVAHHQELLNQLRCSSLVELGSKSVQQHADCVFLVPYAVYFCLAMRQEEALARRSSFGGMSLGWPLQLQQPEDSMPSRLWKPLARLCVEAFHLLETRDVCFEVMRLLYKTCFYRQYFHPDITTDVLDILLLEAGPALVGLAGEKLPRDKASDSWRAFDYFSDLLMRNLGQKVLGGRDTSNLKRALQQQLQPTCIVLEAAIRITATSDEPGIPPYALLELAGKTAALAVQRAQQYVPTQAADALPPQLFSLLLSCVKLAVINKNAPDTATTLDVVQQVLSFMHVPKGSATAAVELQNCCSTRKQRVWLPSSSTFKTEGVSSSSSSGSSSSRRAANVTPLAPWLHLLGRALGGLGLVVQAVQPAIRSMSQARRSTLITDISAAADSAVTWLGEVLKVVAEVLKDNTGQQQQQQQGGTSSVAANDDADSTGPNLMLTLKGIQQLQQQQQQGAAAIAAAENDQGAISQQLIALDAVQQQLQVLGATLSSAAPVVYCCNNPACLKFNRLSERMAKGICSRCRAARYCSGDCQALHWPLHKAVCKASRAA